MRSFHVGGIACLLVEHGRGRGTPEWLFPTVAGDELGEALAGHVAADGLLEFTYSSLVVRTGDRLVLIDAGFPDPAPLAAALRAAGARPGDVDVVVVSHGHPDHVGGLARAREGRLQPSFPNARHVVAVAELAHWTATGDDGPGARLRAIEAAGLVEPADGERDVAPGIRVLPAPGHTPGHLAVAISSQGDSALYVGDALAHEVNVARPDWDHFSDMIPGLATRTRRRLVERAARDGSIVVASHLPAIGRVVAAGGGGHAFARLDLGAAR